MTVRNSSVKKYQLHPKWPAISRFFHEFPLQNQQDRALA